MRDIEKHNLAQIQALNQRGGSTLSLLDLMEAGTVSPQLVGFALCTIARGASVLMGAGPSGAGKSTLLANVLCLLPPGERIITTRSSSMIEASLDRPPTAPECYLAHEIGPGHWYGYVWGTAARDFMRLMDTGRRVASCLHADSLEEAEQILTSPPLFVDAELVHRLGLVGFVRFVDSASRTRRLEHLYSHAPGVGLLLAFRWRSYDDTHDMVSEPEAFGIERSSLDRATQFAQSLVDDNVRLFEDVRSRVIGFYQREGW